MVKKILITGITGFAGSFLAEHLLFSKENTVYGISSSKENSEIISFLKDRVEIDIADLKDEGKVYEIVKRIKPNYIFHLAALAFPATSFNNPLETIINNVSAQVNILEAVKKLDLLSCRVLVVSSADIYGFVDRKNIPISEETPLKPNNPYAVSKVTQDFLGLQYFLSHKLQIVRVRPFNHIGPRQSTNISISSFAKRIAEIEKGIIKPVLRVGNLDTKRDLTDVRDMVYAYVLALEKGVAGEVYNIGSGISYRIGEILDMLLSFSKADIKIEIDKALFRPSDIPELKCNTGKFESLSGWKPKITIEKTIRDTLDYWRKIV